MPSHIFTRLGLWDDSIASNIASARSAIEQTRRLHGGGGSFDQLHAMDYLVYAYLQEGKNASARSVLAEMSAITKLDDNQFQAAYAFAASPARWALEQHDWKAASALEVKPAWFPWDRFRNAEALVHYARAIGAGRAGDAGAAHRATDEIAAIRRLLPQTRDYDWAGSIGAQWETANALATYAEGKKAEAIRLLRAAADHEDAVDKHPVTPGALLPAREILADLLLESGVSRDALREYEAVLKIAPRRFNATAGAAKAAAQAGDVVAARAYAKQLLEIAAGAESPRPELLWARGFLQQK
jgi:tetratricopeptide (TPR) repeat protein